MTATTISCSGSDSSDGCIGGAADSGQGHRRLPVSRNGSYRRPLSPAMSPSLRSLQKVPSPCAGSAGVGQLHAAQHHHRDASPLRSWSDGVSVRSLASIGMGSTDGRKLTITKVPTSPAELLNLASPQQ